MIVLADNDILLKLARCDLFDEFLTAFDTNHSEIRILKTARFAITSLKHRKRLGNSSFARLTDFLQSIGDIDVEPDPLAIAALTEQTDKNIDAGEAILYAVCPRIPKSIIVTGDKKSLVGLAASARDDPVCLSLSHSLLGRVVCFEQILERILFRFGFDSVRQKLIDGRESDRGLAIWLGSGLDATELSFRDALTSYIADVRGQSGELLARLNPADSP